MKKPTAYLYLLLLLLLGASTMLAQKPVQKPVQDPMQALNFLVGEWIGTTKIYENGTLTQQGAAYEKIAYDLDQNILVIALNTEFLQLHTIITYNQKTQKYQYHRFSKTGAAIYPAEFKEGKLIVWKDKQTRFFFCKTPEGGFKEYGEQWRNGQWIKIFEDYFTNAQ